MQSCDRATSPVATRRCMCLNISNSWRWRSGAIKHSSTISLQLSASSTCAGNAANAERVSQQREYTKTITGLLFLSCKSDTWILICADLQFVNPQSNRCRSLSDSKAVIFQFTHYLRNHKVTLAPFRHRVRLVLWWHLCWGVSERPFVSGVSSLSAVLIKDHFVLLMNVAVEERSGQVDRTGLHIQICAARV